MKKLKRIIPTIILTLTPFAALADNSGVYFKGMLGMNKLDNIKNFNDLKQKSNFSPELSLGAGAGFNFDDTLRAEVTFSYTKVQFYNNNKISTFYDTSLNTKKTVINTTMLSVYKDFFDVAENVSAFVGVGAGVSQINETVHWKILLPDQKNSRNIKTLTGATYRKTAYSFTHSLIAGLNFKVSPQLNVEVAYNFKNYGLTKPKTVGKVYLDEKHYVGHSIYTGIRYNI